VIEHLWRCERIAQKVSSLLRRELALHALLGGVSETIGVITTAVCDEQVPSL
jgi:hypothetical protein